ncbi:MAG: hypothetical protein JO034_09520 [Singulisphaera sp.]|nr:hypothetical protein [Singulisphaera sp.]
MVKFAREEKPFDPISNKLLSAIATPPAGPAEDPPAPPLAAPPASAPLEAADGPAEGREGAEAGPALKEGPKPARAQRAKRQVAEKPAPPGRGERLSRAVKCLFTPSEERELRALVGRLAAEAGTSLTLSHLMRPYFDLLLHCEEQLAQELRRADIVRPLNDKTALAYFEHQLAEVIHTAFRKTPMLRTERADGEA